jgi:hypothetical protein
MWAPGNGANLPTFNDWLDAAELLLGQPSSLETGALFTSYELADGTLESVERFGKASVAEVVDRHKWLTDCQNIARTQGFFHWELEQPDVFAHGGFDLQIGNPPWVRPTWDEPASLAEPETPPSAHVERKCWPSSQPRLPSPGIEPRTKAQTRC